jgi:hypothetical protein
MVQLKTIAPALQEDVISSFWTMLRECESRADDEKDPVLCVWVEGWYRQWNRMTGDDKQPVWLMREASAKHVCGLQGFGALGDTCPGCTNQKASVPK